MPAVACEAIDRLITVEMRFASGFPRGIIPRLYDAARSRSDGPLTHRAAAGLVERVHPGDYVFLVTGAGGPPHLPAGETDGPVGAAALGRALSRGLGARPVFIVQAHHLPPLRAACEAVALSFMDDAWVAARRGGSAAWRALPGEPSADAEGYREALETFHPAAVIFIEKLGPNDQGVWHTVNGVRVPPYEVGYAHLLAERARQQEIFTVGIGDGGNEIGFGCIAGAVREIHPYGRACRCGCGGGVGTTAPADVLVVAAISNWGAYGVAAALAILRGEPGVLHDAAVERQMLERCVSAGGFDGNYAAQVPFVDGTSADVQAGLVAMLGQIVANALRSHDRGF
ncbi:MAG TPA: glutamate cyclase domain-containing protein [Gemmatimonadales bacterium]|nr:glutamate cyclase domain-containing protein [Gemmatimonadales bacterium]